MEAFDMAFHGIVLLFKDQSHENSYPTYTLYNRKKKYCLAETFRFWISWGLKMYEYYIPLNQVFLVLLFGKWKPWRDWRDENASQIHKQHHNKFASTMERAAHNLEQMDCNSPDGEIMLSSLFIAFISLGFDWLKALCSLSLSLFLWDQPKFGLILCLLALNSMLSGRLHTVRKVVVVVFVLDCGRNKA